MEFEWDWSKDIDNLQKHGVTFAEVVETFSDPAGFQLRDAKHSALEARFYWVGKSIRKNIDDAFYHPRRRYPNFRIGSVAEVCEAVQ